MSIEKYLKKMKEIQDDFLEFIDDDEKDEENFQKLNLLLEDKKIRDNKNDLSLFLRHVASVCTNHHRGQNFFSKIERVLMIFKDDMKNFYTNSEIFNIFKRNKRILLFLIEEKMIIFDEYVAKTMIEEKYVNKKYPQYFAPEIKSFMNEKWFPKYDTSAIFNANLLTQSLQPNFQLKSAQSNNHSFKNKWVEEIKKELPTNFYELRKTGENESYICKLIRDDNAEEFITHVSQSNLSLESLIDPSIYETNSFLIKKLYPNINELLLPIEQKSNRRGVTLIEYAAFFGSIQIINYLKTEGVEITSILWLYAIHSQNAELIHFLEECHVEPTVFVGENRIAATEEKSYKGCFIESIKCNHNNIADFFLNNYLPKTDLMSNDTFIQSLKNYCFEFIQKENVNEKSFFQLCIYDYYLFVEILLANKDININNQII